MNVQPKHTLLTAPIVTYGDPFTPALPTASLERIAGQEQPLDQAFLQESVALLHELDLGQHTLLMMSDGSMDLFAHGDPTPNSVENGLHLESDETYRLFICLHEQFQRKEG